MKGSKVVEYIEYENCHERPNKNMGMGCRLLILWGFQRVQRRILLCHPRARKTKKGKKQGHKYYKKQINYSSLINLLIFFN